MRDFKPGLWFSAALLALAVAAPAEAVSLRADGRFFRDEKAAVVTLRGLNLAADAKVPNFRPIGDPALLDRLPGLGVNVARLVFTWEAFEPERGTYDASYLDYYAGVVDALHARGVWVIVDIHQDAFSRFATDGCGEGMPGWAISPSVVADVPDNGPNCSSWGIKLILDTDTHRSWNDFYADVGGVRGRYLAMLGELARRFASHPAVIGYDMLNEPWGDEVTQIGPLHEDAAKVLRTEDPDAILFVSPQVLTSAGQDTLLPKPSFDNFAYSPHYYDGGIVLAKVWAGSTLEEPMERMFARANSWNAPLFVGEFGGPADAENVGAYNDAYYAALDARFASGAQWALAAKWDPVKKDGWNTEDFSIIDDAGELRPNFRHRAHPVRTSGEPLRFSSALDPEPVIELTWMHRPDLGKTRIFAPIAELFTGHPRVVTQGNVACAYENDRRHLSCESAEAGEKTVRLERCRAQGGCPDSPSPGDDDGGCSVSSGRAPLPTPALLACLLVSFFSLRLRRRGEARPSTLRITWRLDPARPTS
jgi:endoglycosylceramidase